MTNKTKAALAAAGLAISMIALAQQNPQPQSQVTQQTVPCAEPHSKPSRIHFHLPKQIQDQIDKERAQIEKERAEASRKAGVDVPVITPQDLQKQAQKPCKAPAVTNSPTN